jgi:hypothetical protein
MKIVQIRHVIHEAIIWHLFLKKTYQSEFFECSHIFKKFISICISKKNKNLTIAMYYVLDLHDFHAFFT